MGLFFLPPLHTFLVAFFLASREHSGRRQPPAERSPCIYLFIFSLTFTFQLLDKPWSQVGVVPSPPRFLPSIFIAHGVQQSHCSSIIRRLLLTHALAFSASPFVHKKKSQRVYNTSMHSAGLELTKLINMALCKLKIKTNYYRKYFQRLFLSLNRDLRRQK